LYYSFPNFNSWIVVLDHSKIDCQAQANSLANFLEHKLNCRDLLRFVGSLTYLPCWGLAGSVQTNPAYFASDSAGSSFGSGKLSATSVSPKFVAYWHGRENYLKAVFNSYPLYYFVDQ
jgi:hypothetical protein